MTSATHLTPHFSRWEMKADETPAEYQSNLLALAELLEEIRAAVGNVPLAVKRRTYRAPTHNATLPGASRSSQHLTASAADVTPVGISVAEFLRRLAASHWAASGGFGRTQLIVYPVGSDHIHIGLPLYDRDANVVLVQTSLNPASPRYAAVALADSAARYSKEKRRLGAAALGIVLTLVLLGLLLAR